MGFKFASFGAATVPLSKVIIDKDLNMGPYAIKGVYRPEEWATETLDLWEDGEPEELYRGRHIWPTGQPKEETITTIASRTKITVKFSMDSRYNYIEIKADGEVIAKHDGLTGYSLTMGPVIAQGVISIYANVNDVFNATTDIIITSDGITYEDRTFDLTGKWLALGIDMKGLDATVKIQGVEVPYSDYAKYFPLAPTELKIPGEWNSVEERPVIKVYKGV